MGGGSTEWKYLVDTLDDDNSPVKDSTPTHVDEGGPSWGIVLGYRVGRNFSVELQYMQFANAHIKFADDGTYAIVYGITQIISKTEAYSLSGKFFSQIANTHLRAFAAVGAGLVNREDVINNSSCVTPYLSAGIIYNLSSHWMLESGFQYYTGFGAAEMEPVKDFIPFAWDAYARLVYQI